jgi:hypothetical protein
MPSRDVLHGALPAEPTIAEIKQEDVAVTAILVEHNGPISARPVPSRSGAAFSQICASGSTTQVLGKDLRRARVTLLSTDNPFLYASRETAVANSASCALWPINVALVLTHGDEVHVACATGGDVSTIAVIAENFDGN